jgi:hypothetical protein
MKNLLTLLLLLFCFTCFSQEAKNVKNGYITFNSGTTLYFKDLTIQDGKVTYTGSADTQTEVALSGVKKIVDNAGVVIYTTEKQVATRQQPVETYRPKQESEKLVYKSYVRINQGNKRLEKDKVASLLKVNSGIYDLYGKGRSEAMWGDILMGGGFGFAVGTGIGNLILSEDGKKGGPGGIIVGVAVAVVGIPIKLGGIKKVKEAVNRYNNLEVKEVSAFSKAELKVVAGAGTVGLEFRF